MAGKTWKEIIKGLPGFCCFYLKKKVGRMGKAEGEGKDQMEEEALIQASDGSKAN